MDGAVPDRELKGETMNEDSEDIPVAYLLYVVFGIVLVVTWAVAFFIRIF